MAQLRVQLIQEIGRRFGDRRAGAEDRLGPGGIKRIIVRGGMTPPTTIMMSARPCCFELRAAAPAPASGGRRPASDTPTICTSFSTAWRAASSGVWNSGPISTSKPRSAKADGDHLLPAVVAVLAHLGDQDARAAAFVRLERVGQLADACRYSVASPDLRAVDPGDGADLGLVAAERPSPARRRSRPTVALARAASTRQLQQIARAGSAASVSASSAGSTSASSRSARSRCELVDLRCAHGRLSTLSMSMLVVARRGGICSRRRSVCWPRVDARLRARRRLLDAHLGQAGLDGLGHAAELLDLLDMAPGARAPDRAVSRST